MYLITSPCPAAVEIYFRFGGPNQKRKIQIRKEKEAERTLEFNPISTVQERNQNPNGLVIQTHTAVRGSWLLFRVVVSRYKRTRRESWARFQFPNEDQIKQKKER
jgi:hypothetical protein